MTTNHPPYPGWYPDPRGEGGAYWDGQAWSGVRLPLAPAPRRFTINYGFVLLALLSLVVTLFLGLSWLTYDGTETIGVLWLLWGGFWTLIWGAFAVQHTLRKR